MTTRTNEEIREWVKVEFGHLSKARQRKIRDELEYVRDFYEDDGITPRRADSQTQGSNR
jgi:hypothetical protein